MELEVPAGLDPYYFFGGGVRLIYGFSAHTCDLNSAKELKEVTKRVKDIEEYIGEKGLTPQENGCLNRLFKKRKKFKIILIRK